LHERLLTAMKRSWDATAPLPENWHTSEEILPLKTELMDLVKKNFLGRPLWLWKDPRTCLLLPLWKDVLAEFGIDLRVVFVVRNPLDVARSLEKRNGFTIDKGLGIWFNHTITALKAVEGLETVFLSYDRFLDKWEAELKRCSDGLEIGWPVDIVAVRAKMANFIRGDLRHSASGMDELNAVTAPEPVIQLYALLLEIISGKAVLNTAESIIATMYQEFFSYARLFTSDMNALADCRLHLAEAVTSPQALPIVAELENELNTRTQWAWKLDAEVKAKVEQLASLQSSMSWKLTQPLRDVHRLMLKLLQGK